MTVTSPLSQRSDHLCSRRKCGRPADAIHLVDNADGGYPRHGVAVRFSCARHDAGGYVISLADFELDPDGWLGDC